MANWGKRAAYAPWKTFKLGLVECVRIALKVKHMQSAQEKLIERGKRRIENGRGEEGNGDFFAIILWAF